MGETKKNPIAAYLPDLQRAVQNALQGSTKTQAARTEDAVMAADVEPKKSGLRKIADAGLNLAKQLAPDLLGMVPGVGPILKFAASTLNDDEWFQGFTGTGATFAEYLETKQYAGNQYQGLAAVLQISTIWRGSLDYEPADGEFMSQFFPSVIAYVRNQTNNVLNENINAYSDAFNAAIALYALYYQGMKYIKLSEKQPLNIPMLPSTLTALDPVHYSSFKGVVEALGDFLKSSVRIPAAMCGYLRWRFGTTFHSDNTGRPGLVLYDWEGTTTPKGPYYETYNAVIDAVRRKYTAAGRAGADLKLAYDSHEVKWDVDDPHFDEKEFNLRTNLDLTLKYDESTGGKAPTAIPDTWDDCIVYLDSRLDQSAALQAVTISNRGPLSPFPVSPSLSRVHFYWSTANVPLRFFHRQGGEDSAVDYIGYPVGWHSAPAVALDIGIRPRLNKNGPEVPWKADFMVAFDDPTCGDAYIAESSMERGAQAAYDRLFATLLLESMQKHHNGICYKLGGTQPGAPNLDTNPHLYTSLLSYDMARLSGTQLTAISRVAVRNLTRGDYKRKTVPTAKPEVQEAVAEVAQPIKEAIVADIKEK